MTNHKSLEYSLEELEAGVPEHELRAPALGHMSIMGIQEVGAEERGRILAAFKDHNYGNPFPLGEAGEHSVSSDHPLIFARIKLPKKSVEDLPE